MSKLKMEIEGDTVVVATERFLDPMGRTTQRWIGLESFPGLAEERLSVNEGPGRWSMGSGGRSGSQGKAAGGP